MFDANILYYAHDNVEGDDFGVGYLGDKQWWTDIVNNWGEQDGARSDFTTYDWEDLTIDNLRGIRIAEVVPEDNGYTVTWAEKNDYNTVAISPKGELSWVKNTTKNSSIPRWLNRLKTAIKEYKNQ